MLKTLDIENIAVIEKTSVEFSSGLNVLTGETGAGKSIVVDSINAILGERTSRELVRNGADNAFVSAYFEDINDNVSDKLTELGYDSEDDKSLLITRKINSSGKSVCRINGKSATVSILKEVGNLLVNIHGQHDSQALLNPDLHYNYIDMLSDDKTIIEDYRKSFKELIGIRRKLKSMTNSETDKERELEILDYQINELESAQIKIGEREKLTKRRELILKSESLTIALNNLLSTINGDEETNGIQSLVNSCGNFLSSYDELKNICQILININDELETIKDMADSALDEVRFDSNELEVIEERLDLLYRLSNKYGSTEQEMLDFLENARNKRNSINYADIELEKLNSMYDKIFDITVTKADKLSEHRRKIAAEFERQVKKELEFLDMPKLQFFVKFEKGKLSVSGYDKIEFLISTNPGEPAKPLSKIASGGELSRIMLAIKNILSNNDTVDTLIFDEIDTGISGRASQKIGLKLKAVSKNTQVICVTHSAQIASNADKHFLISKRFENDRTYTIVTPLDYEARKNELARIMGGLEVTDTLLASAEELLNTNYKL